jgi:Secretion system C-terminal sorting domain
MAQYAKTPLLDFATSIGIQEIYVKSISKTDASGNVYTGGATKNQFGNYDVILVKTSPAGAILWTKVYAGVGNGDDALVNFVIDASMNVFVVGTVYTSATNKNDIVTIKYNSAGAQQWLQTYNAPASGLDVGADIVIGNNNIYVTGGVQTTNGYSDFATIKYNSAGVFQWVRTYDSVGLFDGAQKITYVNTGIGEITVAGGAQQALTSWKFASRKYDANGAVLNTTISGGSASGVDEVHDITKDVAGNIYVTGSIVNIGTGNDMYTVKLSATDLSILWSVTYNSTGSQTDKSNSVTVDASNNVYITGYSQHATEGKNYTTIKYNSSGVQQWIQTYNGVANGDDEAAALLFDNNFVYVTGTSKINGNKDYYTICYTNAGVQKWAIGFNGTNNKDDIAAAIAIDNQKSIIVAGQSNIGPANNTYTTVKYLQKDIYNPKPTIAAKGKAGYVENRTQILNTNLTPNTTIKFYCDQSYPSTYIDDSKISYLFSSLDTAETDSLHRVDMQFNKGTGNAKVYPNVLRDTYYNYYMGYMTKNGERTLGYNSIVKFGVYTNTDVIFTQNSRGYRHYIVARSGAPTANFEMQYTGQTSLTVDALGNLKIATTLGTLKQPKAKAYTMNNTTGVLTLLVWQPTYVVTGGNKVSFTYGTWPAGSTLVLEIEKDNEDLDEYEPVANLGWSTYVGSTAWDQYNSVTIDEQGYQYTAGFSNSGLLYPVPGAFQSTNYANTSSAVWNKFDLNHEMLYGTFYGGNSYTQALDIDVIGQTGSSDYKVYLVGTTLDWGLPVIPISGADNDLTIDGTIANGFIARFDEAGILTWARFFAGVDGAEIRSITHDNDNNIYFTGISASNFLTDFPFVDLGGNSYFQNTIENTSGDVFIGKMTDNLNLVWCTLFGGNFRDESTDIEYDKSLDVFYLSGYSYSSNLPIGINYFDNQLNGGTDDFILKFSNIGELLWGSFIGGNNFEGNFENSKTTIALSNTGKICLSSTTNSTNLPAAYNTISWDEDWPWASQGIYLFVLNASTLQPEWAGFFGDSSTEFSTDVVYDKNGGFFMTGSIDPNTIPSISYSSYYIKPFAIDFCDETSDGFICHYNNSYQNDWRTAFGGENSCVDGVTNPDVPNALAYFNNGVDSYLYVAGYCGNYSNTIEEEGFPRVDFDGAGTISYFNPNYVGGKYDAFISMFNTSIISVGISNYDTENTEIKIFPIPSSNEITIYISNYSLNNAEIFVYNLLGQNVINLKPIDFENHTYQLPISRLSNGQYNLIIKEKGMIIGCSKFIKN